MLAPSSGPRLSVSCTTASQCKSNSHLLTHVYGQQQANPQTSDPADRPTAETLLRAPFCFADNRYNFLDTELYAKIRGAF
jgi:hypothetical protein